MSVHEVVDWLAIVWFGFWMGILIAYILYMGIKWLIEGWRKRRRIKACLKAPKRLVVHVIQEPITLMKGTIEEFTPSSGNDYLQMSLGELTGCYLSLKGAVKALANEEGKLVADLSQKLDDLAIKVEHFKTVLDRHEKMCLGIETFNPSFEFAKRWREGWGCEREYRVEKNDGKENAGNQE